MSSSSDEYYPKYQDLRRANKEYARQEVVRLYRQGKSISAIARTMKCSRITVRKALRRYKEEGTKGFRDRCKRPKNSPRRTPLHIEAVIVATRCTSSIHMRHSTGYQARAFLCQRARFLFGTFL